MSYKNTDNYDSNMWKEIRANGLSKIIENHSIFKLDIIF